VTRILADALAPIFVGLLLGYIAGLRGAMDNKNVQTLITFVMSFAIPSSMFLSIIRTSRAALHEQVPTALLQPAVALGLAMLIHLSIEQTRYVTLISAIPCGFFGVVFGENFNSSPKVASSDLIASYAIGVGTLAAWIVIVNHLP
jgi:predicted permease